MYSRKLDVNRTIMSPKSVAAFIAADRGIDEEGEEEEEEDVDGDDGDDEAADKVERTVLRMGSKPER